MVGPNCMGVINTDPAVRMNATFAPVYPPAGQRGHVSRRAARSGLAMLDYARALNIGFSTFVSVGNKADVSGNDLIQYWAEDPNTRRHPAVPRELRQSAQVRRDRPPGRRARSRSSP